MNDHPEKYYLKDDGTYPNNFLPALHYKNILDVTGFFIGKRTKKLFKKNNWGNNWRHGIYTFHHYHSITHEVIGIIKGKTTLQLGGEKGPFIMVKQGDVLIIPAGVAHKNLGKENQVICIGGYPEGKNYDINYGKANERPGADHNIAALPVPVSDPVLGIEKGVTAIWRNEKIIKRL